MRLHLERHGAGPRIVLVHGFTQNRRCWGSLGDDLATDHEVVLVDAPGHGRSGPVVADLPTGGRLLAEVGGEATYLGYSMGARFCLHTALAAPERVRGLVLVGATAGIDDELERSARRDQDLRTAERIEALGLEAFLAEWLAQPIFSGLSSASAATPARLENTVAGLRSSLEHAGTGSQIPLWDRLAELSMPVLVMAGALDAKFAALGARLTDSIGHNATLALVEDAGHAAHLEAPEAFLALVRPWLAAHDL